MTKKMKLTISIVFVLTLIIATPFLFFLGIGENPFFDRSNGIKKIAIVNEDAGTEKKEQNFDFGKEMIPILSSDSDYEWLVVSRGVTEKGLLKGEYDAVLYIPSDFSRNIMSYEEQQPAKSEFKYKISDQLNAMNREKILREIQKASSRVNGKISTLYWSYVSQDLQKVREQFDTILNKEMEFLNTISDYYQPNMETVVREIENQKGMLESLHSAIDGQGTSIGNSADQANEFEVHLLEFVSLVEKYKEFQAANQQLLQTMQDENVQLVMKVKTDQQPRFEIMKNQLNKANEMFSTNIGLLENQLVFNHKTFVELKNHASTQQQEILGLLKQIEGELVIEYENEVIAMRNRLATSPTVPTKKNNENVSANSSNVNEYITSSKIAALEAEREKLGDVLQQVINIKGNIENESTTTTEGANSEIVSMLTNLTNQLTNIGANIELIQQQESELQQKLITSQVAASEENQVEDISITEKIKNQESELVNLEQLSDGKRSRLSKIFHTPLPNVNEELLLAYFESLVKYKSVISTQLLDENNKGIDSKLNELLDLLEQNEARYNELNSNMPATREQLATIKGDISEFFTAQLGKLETDYSQIAEQMTLIEQSANSVKEQMNVLVTNVPVPADDLQGTNIVSNQQTISQELQYMKESMDMVTDNQENLINVTDQLQSKAQGVNADTYVLSTKWNENVGTTKLYRDDIHAILNGSFVDGQKNGQIYEHLSTPLATSSLDSNVQQENKMPPVIVLVIVLISGLMIGYFCYYFKQDNIIVRLALFGLLNVIVGLIISVYGLDIYALNEQRAIEWTIFTIVLLTTLSALIFAGFSINNLVGWFVTILTIVFFIIPVLTLIATNINYEDPISKVYLSIQYGTDSLLVPALIVLAIIIIFTVAIPVLVNRLKKESVSLDDEPSMEV